MSHSTQSLPLPALLQRLEGARAAGQLSEGAVQNLQRWLTEPRYAAYLDQVARHIQNEQWRILDDVFWTVIPFGTGGRRGRMYPIGSNAINERTIGESAQGLVAYVRSIKPNGPWSGAIAYDTRHRSREFAELCAGIMVAGGFQVYFLDDYRSTPELSFLVRAKRCDCGIMVTASHNPPSDNAVKVYWSNGAQLVPPHDQGVIEYVNRVESLQIADFASAVAAGKIHFCLAETDAALLAEHRKMTHPGPRRLRVIYSPLHGVGEFNVSSLLQADGFKDVEIFEPHRQPDGDFPNVPEHVSNPENPAVFDTMIRHAQATDADLILATDPDCDRMGAAAPRGSDSRGLWQTFNGNQLSALLADFVLRKRHQAGTLTPRHYTVTTLVTTPMVRRITEAYGARCYDDNLVGFKWIGNLMDQVGPEFFVYGTEESHGFLVGEYCRDKDGAVACMLMSELAAEAKAAGRSVHEQLDALYGQYGLYRERLLNLKMEGSDGMRRMQSLMDRLRSDPPPRLGGLQIEAVHDYRSSQTKFADGRESPLVGPRDNLVRLETSLAGNAVSVRPSGTEPKVKFYLFAHQPAEQLGDLEQAKANLEERLAAFERDLRAFAQSLPPAT